MSEPRFADYDDVHREVLMPLFDQMTGWGNGVHLAEALARLPAAERTLLVAECCFGAVGDGGFPSVFYNSTGDLAPEAKPALVALGLPQAAECFALAIEHFAGVAGVPYHPALRDWDKRNEVIEADLAAHPEGTYTPEELDERFFEAVPSEVFDEAAVRDANTHLP